MSSRHSQLSQDSPEQEASKSPRGGVPGGGEASLPSEGTPQMSLQSPASITSYSQVRRGGVRVPGDGGWEAVGGFMNQPVPNCVLGIRDAGDP